MLSAIRDRASSLVAYIIIGLLILSFALWGIQEYFGGGGAPPVADVNGVEITQPEFNNQFQQYRQRLQSILGENFAQRYPDESVIRKQVINDMVNTEILRQTVTDAGFRISDTGLIRKIRQIPQFQRDGKFAPELYTRLLQAQRYDKARFEAELREEEKLGQFEIALVSSSFKTKADLQRFQRLSEQSRDFSYALVRVDPDSVTISQDQIDDYYNANQSVFRTPEQVRLAYIELKEEALVDPARVTDDDARAIYAEQAEQHVTSELRKVRHILTKVPEQTAADAPEWGEALGKASEYVRQLEAGASFAELARQHSEDTLSAGKGGDIGFIAPGDLASSELEKVLFSLSPGAHSQPVRTEQGVQIVQLVEIQASEQKSFAQVRQQIIDERKSQLAQERFVEIVDELINLVVEQPDDLTEAAELFELAIRETGWLTLASDAEIFAYPEIRSLAFTEDILAAGLNSELIEVADGHVIAFRLLEHRESELQPLDEVAGGIRDFLRMREAAQQAVAEGEEMYAQMQSGLSLEALSAKYSLERVRHGAVRRDDDRVPARILARAFTLPRPGEGQTPVNGLPLVDGSFALLELHSVMDGPDEMDDARALELSQRVHYGRREFSAILETLREGSDVQVFEDNL